MAQSVNEGEAIEPLAVEILRQGKEIIIPPGMDYDTAIKWLKRRRDEESQEVHVSRTYNFFPSEGALALTKVLSDRYGWVKASVIPQMFGSRPPQLMAVEVALGATEQVPFGRFEIPNVRGYVQCGVAIQDELPCFKMDAIIAQGDSKEIEALYDHVGRIALEDTPYRSAALRLPYIEGDPDDHAMEDYFPKFLDVRSADLKNMVFSQEIEELLMDNVFGPVMHTEAFRSSMIPLKMGVLLEGEYGCGKTLVANLLAKSASENGWTYILCEDASDLARCVKVARRFEPCVVFCEDIDREVAGQKRTKSMDKILNTIDGIEAKGTEIMIVLTTNHVDDVTPAMRRPGRLDVVIPVGPPDEEAAGRMIALYAGDQIDIGEDLTEVSKLLAGKTPAVLREVVERSKRTSIVMADDDAKPGRITGENLARAARGMKRHLDLLEITPEPEKDGVVQVADAILELASTQ